MFCNGRNNLWTKTAHKNQTDGSVQTSTSEIGWITKSTDSASSITRTAISTKGDGKPTKGTVKARIGLLTQKTSSGGSTLAIGNPTKNKEEVPCSTSLVTGTMVCGWTIFPMEKEEWSSKTETSMKECGSKAKEVGMEYSRKDVETISKVIGSTIWEKVKDLTFLQKRIKSLSDNGLQMLQKQEFILKSKIQAR